MITMMITKDDNKGDDKKLKYQSKNNSSESKINQRTTQVNQRSIKEPINYYDNLRSKNGKF